MEQKHFYMKATTIFDNNYFNNLILSLKDKRTQTNASDIIFKIISERKIQLWSISTDKREYERFHNLINGNLVNVLDKEIMNKNLLINSLSKLSGELRVVVVYDGSDIRKPESEKLENLGWVRDLDGKFVRGYQTMNCIMIDNNTAKIKLLNCQPYSNKDPKFVSEREMKLFEKDKLKDENRKQEIERYLENEDNYNAKQIIKNQILTVHEKIREINSEIVIIHVFDRGFDSEEIFEMVDAIGDKFVIRFKSNRTSSEKIEDEKGKEYKIKLQKKTFENAQELKFEKVIFKKKTYFDATATYQWESILLGEKLYHVEKITFRGKNGENIFKDPMMLISNYNIFNFEMAQYVYQIYQQRTKIEGVFKFLKEVLGWETFRLHDYESIMNLICLTFFIGAYFYEIEDELINNETVEWICKLGKGKGKISRYFFMKGIAELLKVAEFENFRKENNITDEQILFVKKKYLTLK
jgi:hypothetical protein